MKDNHLDPVVAQRVVPDKYKETIDAFFTDLAEQESGDYVTNIKRVLALDYVLLSTEVDEKSQTESDRVELTYQIESISLSSLTVQNVSGSNETNMPHKDIRENFEFVPLDATFEIFDEG